MRMTYALAVLLRVLAQLVRRLMHAVVVLLLLTVLSLSVVLLLARRSFRFRRIPPMFDVILTCRYATGEQPLAQRLFNALHDSGIRVFWVHHIYPAVDFGLYLRNCNVILPVICVDTFTSRACLNELRRMLENSRSYEVAVLPILWGGEDLSSRIPHLEDPHLRQTLLEVAHSPDCVAIHPEFYAMDEYVL